MNNLLEDAHLKSATNNQRYRGFLTSSPLFSEFSESMITKALERSVIKKHGKGKLIFINGDRVSYIHLIVSGWVKLFRQTHDGHEAVLSVLTQGDVFSRCAILEKNTLPYSVQSITESTLLLVPGDFIKSLAEKDLVCGGFLSKILEDESNDCRVKSLEIEHLALMNSEQRLRCFLLKMCGELCKGRAEFKLPYEKSLIAAKLGMTPENLSRTLHKLSDTGITIANSTVTVANIEDLKNSVCYHCSALYEECSHSVGSP